MSRPRHHLRRAVLTTPQSLATLPQFAPILTTTIKQITQRTRRKLTRK